MKKVLFIAIVTILVTHAHSVYAYTYSRTPSGVSAENPVTFNMELSNVSELGSDILTNGSFWGLELYGDGMTTSNVLIGCIPITDTLLSETITLPVGDYQGVGIFGSSNVGCPSANQGGEFEPEPYTGGTVFTVLSGNTNQTWGSNNGFWGDTSIGDVTTAMEASVQATGANVWQLLTFVGIPLAFLLAGFLIYLINKQLTPVKSSAENKEIINPGGSDFIYHSAEDLEFKRNYGQETTKRKRGRPRKVL